MHGRKCFVGSSILIALIGLSACSTEQKLRKADCYDCTTETQSWNSFAWNDLAGTWRGSLETVVNEYSAKQKKRNDTSVEIRFLEGTKFLTTQNIGDCGSFPKNAVVVNGALWTENEKVAPKANSYEVFGKLEGDEVTYGRATLSKVNGSNICSYSKIGTAVGMNRLALPSVHFSQRLTPDGRTLASGNTSEFQVNFEFLNFEPSKAASQSFVKGSRKPASIAVQDNPPLMFRVFKVVNSVKGPFDQGQWVSTQENIYRLWRVQ